MLGICAAQLALMSWVWHPRGLSERDPLRLFADLRALRDSGMISAVEFQIRESAISPEI